MQQLSLASAALPDVLSEFLEVAIHMILFVRGLYPPELFESTQKYSCPLKTARHPDLVSYIQHIVQGIRTELQKDTIHRVCVVTLDSSKRAVDRFVFETNVFRPFHDEQSNTNAHDSTLDVAREDKGKGKAVDEYDYQHEDDERLRDEDMDEDEDDEPLHKTRPEGREKRHCSFTVLIEMKSSNTGPEVKADFPWAPVSALSSRDHGKVSAPVDDPGPKRKIIPVKTIEIADVQLELYIEQLP
ncbi:MAD2 mitotic arrest deficient-like 2 [Podila verticillata]|nr:MAD2 mitotic arrest deficient-like 2 [Podila verticillata]